MSENSPPFIAIVGLWITEDFVYEEVILDFVEVNGSHTGENLATCLEFYNLDF
jgi:hypothetical protein